VWLLCVNERVEIARVPRKFIETTAHLGHEAIFIRLLLFLFVHAFYLLLGFYCFIFLFFVFLILILLPDAHRLFPSFVSGRIPVFIE
jgi:hypothetical protein